MPVSAAERFWCVLATQYDFTCPDGHKFSAIAKLRARCPTCGKTARRNFSILPESSTSSPSSHKVVQKKDMGNGSKPDLTSTKIKESSSTPAPKDDDDDKSSSASPTSTKKPVVVKQGLKRLMPKTVSKKPAPKAPVPVATRGPVTRKVAKVGHTPIVTRPPRGSKERKVIEQTSDVPYWQQVKRKFFG